MNALSLRSLERDPRSALDEFHRSLTSFNRRRLTPTCGSTAWRAEIADEAAWRLREAAFVVEEQERIAGLAAEAPTDVEGFVAWFEALKEIGPGQHDPLFPWLAEEAPREAMIEFLTQEVAGEAGFDDLVAMTQVKLPTQAKLELARNYWDEMGQGKQGGMHGPMLDVLVSELAIDRTRPVVWETLALGNLMTALAMNRRFAFHSVGALGVIELTAPGRAEQVNAGLKRLGLGGEARRYYALHSTLDVKHSIAWNREVLRSLVAADPATARAMAEGALMRLEAGRRCFDRYREELWPRE
ncbi:hypothetical protein BH11MYX4_BH11MYX4_45710 [soil metagenome]